LWGGVSASLIYAGVPLESNGLLIAGLVGAGSEVGGAYVN